MGGVGGGLWHLFRGMKNSPSGARFRGGIEVSINNNQTEYSIGRFDSKNVFLLQSIRREAPRIGGSFAVWGGLFSTFDCTLVALRKKGSLLSFVLASPPQQTKQPSTDH